MRKHRIVPHPMRISFDLDEVLFVLPETHKTEPPPPFPLCRLFKERLRLGTPELIRELQRQGFEVWVYTSSYRTEKYIRRLFSLYGVHFDGIVNAQRHEREVQSRYTQRKPNKMPNYYHISLHVDDEPIIATIGRDHGFNVHMVFAQDDEWAEKIIARAQKIRKNMQTSADRQ